MAFKKNKNEIVYNIINSLIAGSLVFLGALANGSITTQGILFAIGAAGTVAIVKFQHYWDGERGEYSKKLNNYFSFI